ncbi:prostaglandin G/H synthase 1-like [Frankliniella occidentalis]|uniref:prostaglandin-endoperoxide synthase n=1 Tax=Frankliniella occidentalis TaxID=133901 RepID=A0A9C6XPZ3_FRAOC|nr:prostaglandin G/H synthase 1-like [Frankliniella occidentalis]
MAAKKACTLPGGSSLVGTGWRPGSAWAWVALVGCVLAASMLPSRRPPSMRNSQPHVVGGPAAPADNRTGGWARSCCSLPCENGGLCEDGEDGWRCRCEGTGHHGRRCHIVLPAVPAGCPTPLGLAGRRRLPSEEDVFDAVLARPPDAFVADPTGANLLSVAFLHHFLHQFEAGAGDLQPVHAHVVLVLEVDARQVYGASDAARRLLRAPSGGRLLSRLVDGEEFPACVEDAPVDMVYPVTGPGARRRRHLPYYHLTGDAAAPEAEPRWALGHPKLSSTPLVFAMAVVWLREHNRVAALLADAHPHWDGDRLYETARRVVTAEMVLVLLREVVPEVWGWGPRAPGLLRELAAPHHRHTAQRLPLPAELPLALFWGWQLPDVLEVGDDAFNVTDLMFTNQRLVVERGLGAVLQAAATQPAGKACAHNSGRLVKGWTKRLMRDGRRARLQPYARYRALLGLPAHRDFLDLAGGDARTADALLRLYGHVDAVELLPEWP